MKTRSSNVYVALCITLLLATAGYFLLHERAHMLADAQDGVLSGAVAMQNVTSAILEQSAASIEGVRQDLENPEQAFNNAALRGLRDAMRFDPVSSYLGFRDIVSHRYFLMDRNGHLVNSDLTRPLAPVLPAPGSRRLELYPLIQIRGDNHWYLPMVLAVADAHAEVDMLFALVNVETLLQGTTYFKSFPDCFISIVTSDGRRLARFAAPGQLQETAPRALAATTIQFMRRAPAGVTTMWSAVDGKNILMGYSASMTQAFWIVIGLPVGAVMQQWLAQSITPMVVLLVALTFILVLGVRLRTTFTALQATLHEFEYDANHDKLTSLLNRKAFIEQVNKRLAQGQQREAQVMLLNLNRFKDINDAMGHGAGDMLLKEVATRLTASLRGQDTLIARLGADEYVVFAPDEILPQWLAGTDGTGRDSLSGALLIKGAELEFTASIGVSRYPAHGSSTDELLRCASVAMKQAKFNLAAITHYTPAVDDFSPDMLELRADFLKALRTEQLTLHYQPKVVLATGLLAGVEALARWYHPLRGAIPPVKFIPIAEDSELIHEFTQYVLQTALRQIRSWELRGFRVSVAVNVSVNNLLDQRFVERLRSLLDTYRVNPTLLELEVTESAVMRHPELTLKSLHAIRALGVRLSIDDFGTGYASLAYLKQLPVQTIKIDKVFIDNLATDEANQRIVKSSIQLAHAFSMAVVAEGVEQKSAAEMLVEFGCDAGQGYYFARPLDAVQLERAWFAAPVARDHKSTIG